MLVIFLFSLFSFASTAPNHIDAEPHFEGDSTIVAEGSKSYVELQTRLDEIVLKIDENLKKDIRKAESLAIQGKVLSDSFDLFDKKIIFLEYLYAISKESGRYKEAFRYGMELANFKDDLYKKLGSLLYEDVAKNREAEQKERELELLRQESSLQSIKLNQNRITLYVMVTVATLFVVLIVVGYLRYNYKQRSINQLQERNDYLNLQNEELALKNEKLVNSEKHLKELNETKDKFFSIISQDMRAPLASLSGFLKLLINYANSFSPEEMVDLAKKINVSVHKLSGLIDNLLKWSRSQMGSIDFHPRVIELTDLVMDVVDHMRPQYEAKNIEVVVKAIDSYSVHADEEMMFFAIKNLLDNAIKFSPEGEKVEIILESDDWNVSLRVIDQGKGVDGALKEKIWNVSDQLRNKKSIDDKGSGLGLVLAKDFVEKNNGEIGLNKSRESGAEFWFVLPLNIPA